MMIFRMTAVLRHHSHLTNYGLQLVASYSNKMRKCNRFLERPNMSDAHRSGCPINLTLEVLGDKWSLLMIRDIIFGNRRHFRELLTRSEEGIASSILASLGFFAVMGRRREQVPPARQFLVEPRPQDQLRSTGS
jgi:hypothetical protein